MVGETNYCRGRIVVEIASVVSWSTRDADVAILYLEQRPDL